MAIETKKPTNCRSHLLQAQTQPRSPQLMKVLLEAVTQINLRPT